MKSLVIYQVEGGGFVTFESTCSELGASVYTEKEDKQQAFSFLHQLVGTLQDWADAPEPQEED